MLSFRKKFKELKHPEVRILCLTCLRFLNLSYKHYTFFCYISFHTVRCFKFASEPLLLISYMSLKMKRINFVIDTLSFNKVFETDV